MLKNIDREQYYGVAGIYMIFCQGDGITAKNYVGSSLNLYKRVNMHINELKKGIHNNNHLQNAYNKHGKKNFYVWVLKCFYDLEEIKKLRDYEQIYINSYYDGGKRCFNISKDSKVPGSSKESKLKHSEAMKKIWKDNTKNQKLKKATIKNLKKALKASKKKYKYCKDNNIPIESKWKGRKHTEEAKIKQSLAAKKRGRHKALIKKVYQYTLDNIFIKEWDCVSDAARVLFKTYKSGSNISACARNVRKQAGGFKWSYTKY